MTEKKLTYDGFFRLLKKKYGFLLRKHDWKALLALIEKLRENSYKKGYEKGYSDGDTDGYHSGYTDGFHDAND